MELGSYEAIQEIKKSWKDILPKLLTPAKRKVNGQTSFICPFCGHGQNGDGLTFNPRSTDGAGLICFSCNYGRGRGMGKDIIDLYKDLNHIDNIWQAVQELAAMINIKIDRLPYKKKQSSTQAARVDEEPSHAAYYEKCAAAIESPAAAEYLKRRGISMDTAKKYKLGFDPAADPANAPFGQGQPLYPVPRLILPVTNSYYVARAIDDSKVDKQFRKLIPKGGQAALWNTAALDSEIFFVTEGIFDALSILEAGGQAVALNSTSNIELLADALEPKKYEFKTAILSLDNDAAGQMAQTDLETSITGSTVITHYDSNNPNDPGDVSWNIRKREINVAGGYKDCNEALVKDREGFITRVQAATKAQREPYNVGSYLSLGGFKHDIEQQAAPIPTGFKKLDELSGGLQSGLYFLAAISSLGKTTLASQLADNVAAAGKRVLYFSLEQSRAELVSKSLARQIALSDPLSKISSISIRRGFNQLETAQAATDYVKRTGFNLSIIEAGGQCVDAAYVKAVVEKFKPNVAIIDYLQIMDSKVNGTPREKIDRNVLELKRLSREKGITVFVISSINRNAYLSPIDFESFKESGGIEFSADVVYGLQLQALSESLFQTDKDVVKKRERIKQAKLEIPRKLELVCLKNRFGQTAFSVNFEYNPIQELFYEDSKPQWIHWAESVTELR